MYRNYSNHDRLRKNTVVYDRVRWKYGRLRPCTVKIRSFTISVFLRISPYTVTEIYDRNTGPCNTEKYGRIRSVYGMYTVVYDAVYDRLRPYTEFVTADLGWSKEISKFTRGPPLKIRNRMISIIKYFIEISSQKSINIAFIHFLLVLRWSVRFKDIFLLVRSL
jgi:hypothetical protein